MATNPPPTYQDADLILQLFQLRRDEKLRQARDWFGRFFPTKYEDLLAAYNGGDNVYLRMIFGYWDMAASFVNSGILHRDLFLESGGEMLFVWAKIGEWVPALREEISNPRMLANVERFVRDTPGAADRIATMRQAQQKQREKMSGKSA
jgi:hypothetical protein